jgi:hypothetical protein
LITFEVRVTFLTKRFDLAFREGDLFSFRVGGLVLDLEINVRFVMLKMTLTDIIDLDFF